MFLGRITSRTLVMAILKSFPWQQCVWPKPSLSTPAPWYGISFCWHCLVRLYVCSIWTSALSNNSCDRLITIFPFYGKKIEVSCFPLFSRRKESSLYVCMILVQPSSWTLRQLEISALKPSPSVQDYQKWQWLLWYNSWPIGKQHDLRGNFLQNVKWFNEMNFPQDI